MPFARCGTSERGGFFDRSVPEAAERVGLMRERLKPFVANCDAARVLRRLAGSERRSRFRRPGRRHARRHGAAGRATGPLAAHYLLASAAH